MGEFIADWTHWYAPAYLAKLGLSAHAFITPSGTIIRSRADQEGAYHASGYNASSMGVEFLVPGLHTYQTFLEAIRRPWVSEAQYRAGVELVRT